MNLSDYGRYLFSSFVVALPAPLRAVCLFVIVALVLFLANEALRIIAARVRIAELTRQFHASDKRSGRKRGRGRPLFVKLEMLAWMPVAFCLFRLYFSYYRHPEYLAQYAAIYLSIAALLLMLFGSYLWLGKSFYISAYVNGSVDTVPNRRSRYCLLASIVLAKWLVVGFLLTTYPPGG